MASSYRSTTPHSTSSTRRHSRVDDAVQVAPYLTHVVRHHGQVTLIPPENSGRIRKVKKKRPATVRGESSSAVLDLPSTSSPRSRSRPNTPRPQSASSIPFAQNVSSTSARAGHSRHGTQEELGIPDFPPPSFEEAMRSTPTQNSNSDSFDNAQSSTVHDVSDSAEQVVIHEHGASPAVRTTATSPLSPEAETPSPSSSHSSLEELVEQKPRSLWEQDREAGYSLEERVQRELERRRLADSLPRAPAMRLFEESDDLVETEDAGVRPRSNHNGGLERLDRKKSAALQQPGSPESSRKGNASPDGCLGAEVCNVSEQFEPSSSFQIARSDESSRSDNEHPVSSKGKGKEEENVRREPSFSGIPSITPSDQTSSETILSRFRDVLNAPLRPRAGRSDAPPTQVSWTLVTPKRPPSSDLSHGLSPLDDKEIPHPVPHFVPTSTYESSRVSTSTNAVSHPSRPLMETSSDIPHVAPVSSSVAPPSHLASHSSPPSSPRVDPVSQPPLPPRRIPPPVPPTRISVRERISALESLQSRPVPPPPMRPVVRRPPPPVPDPSNIARAHAPKIVPANVQITTPASMVTIVAEQRMEGDLAVVPRRGSPPPVPPRRRRIGSSSSVYSDMVLSTMSPSVLSTCPPEHAATGPPTPSSVNGSTPAEINELDLTNDAIDDENGSAPGRSANGLESAHTRGGGQLAHSSTDIERTALPSAGIYSSRGENLHVPDPSESAGRPARASQNITDGLEHRPLSTSLEELSALEENSGGDSYSSGVVSTSASPTDNTIIQMDESPVPPAQTENHITDVHDQANDTPVALTQQPQPLQPTFTGLTDLDLLLARLDDPDFTYGGGSYDDLLLLEEIMGPATGSLAHHRTRFEDVPLGRVEILRRRVTKDGRVKLKLALLGVIVDKCGICLAQFKGDTYACLLPCRHAFHERCLRLWMRRGDTCPLCRGPMCIA